MTPAGEKRYGKIKDDDIVIKKGSSLGHVTSSKNIRLRNDNLYLYDRRNAVDSDIYGGAYSKRLRMTGSKNIYRQNYETTEDLFSPSEKERKRIFAEVYEQQKDLFNSYLNDVETNYKEIQYMNGRGALSKQIEDQIEKYATHKVSSTYYQDLYDSDHSKMDKSISELSKGSFDPGTKSKSKQVGEYGYFMFNLGASEKAGNPAVRAYYDKVRERGYNALIDDNNRNIYNGASQPFIALYAQTSLKNVGRTKLRDSEINAALERVRRRNESRTGNGFVSL